MPPITSHQDLLIGVEILNDEIGQIHLFKSVDERATFAAGFAAGVCGVSDDSHAWLAAYPFDPMAFEADAVLDDAQIAVDKFRPPMIPGLHQEPM